ncbi:hypothetical protein ACWG0P_15885 [Amedibacillus sp. YH-ame6]
MIALMIGFCSSISAAYTYKVTKSFFYDYNIPAEVNMNYHGYKYIYVADDARLYNEETKWYSSGWNYIRYQTIKYYKNADLNW